MSVIINGTGGGGGTPANPNLSVQYNNGGAFGGFGIYTLGTHTLQLDAADSATPVSPTLQAQSVLVGTSNTSAPNFSLNAGFSTGIGNPGLLVLNTGYQGLDSGKTLSSISNASPAVFTTAAAHNAQGTQSILLSTTGTLPSPLATFTQYFIDLATLTATTFEVSASMNGAVINTTSAGSGTHSYVYGGTINNIIAQILFTNAACTSLMEGMPIQFIIGPGGSFPAQIQPNTTYYVINLELLSFQIAATPGGAIIPVSTPFNTPLAYVVQANNTTRNQIPSNKGAFTLGPSGLFGQDSRAVFKVSQIWNTSSFPYGIPVGGVSGADIELNITNIRNQIQGTGFLTFTPDNQPLNILNVWCTPTNLTNAWRIDSSGGPGTHAPYIEIVGNGNGDPAPINLCGTPVGIVDSGGNTRTNLSVEATAGVLSVLNNTLGSPTSVRAYNTIDVSFGTPTNYERLALDWQTTANVARVTMQNGGTGNPRIIAIDGFQKAGAPAAGDLPAGTWGVINDTAGNATWLCYNNSGTIRKVQLV